MGKGMTTYLDFAENDYMFFKSAYDAGNKGGALTSLGQSICERYLKHIISEYAHPETQQEHMDKESVLKTHSLRRLLKYCESTMEFDIPDEAESAMERIDGFYFSTRYPGDDSFIPTSRDVDKACAAVESARAFALDICRLMEPGEQI